METKINTNAIPDGGIDIEKLKAGIVPDVSHLETKENASAKLQEAKDYTDTKVAELVGTAPETLDTLKEVADAIQENETVVDALNSAIGNKANSSDVYKKQEVDDKIDAVTITIQYAANESEVPAERVPGVVYLVGNETYLITFNIKYGSSNWSCEAKVGMTWEEFINSEYVPSELDGAFIINGNSIDYKNGAGLYDYNSPDGAKGVYKSDIIVSMGDYRISFGSN